MIKGENFMDVQMQNVDKEYNNLVNLNGVNPKLITHSGLRTALIQIFRECIGDEKYNIEVNGDSIIIKKENNYPDAIVGIHHGIKVASECVIKLEKDSDKEYLTVKIENVNIYGNLENRENLLSYQANVTAYDEYGVEKASAQYYTERQVDKYYNPMYMIHSFIGEQGEKPNLDVKFATRNYLSSEHNSSNNKWRYYSVTRGDDLITYRYSVDHIDRMHVETVESYGFVNAYNYERLAGNYQDFAIYDHSSEKLSDWKTLDGKSLTSEELSTLIDEYRVNLQEYLSTDKKR